MRFTFYFGRLRLDKMRNQRLTPKKEPRSQKKKNPKLEKQKQTETFTNQNGKKRKKAKKRHSGLFKPLFPIIKWKMESGVQGKRRHRNHIKDRA